MRKTKTLVPLFLVFIFFLGCSAPNHESNPKDGINFTLSEAIASDISEKLEVSESSYISVDDHVLSEDTVSDPQVITVWVPCYPENSPIWSLAMDFNESNNEYQIQLIDYTSFLNVDSTYGEKIACMEELLVSKKAPDLILLNYYLTAGLADSGILMDLNQILNSAPIMPWLWDLLKIGDCNYSMPISFTFSSVCGNAEIVDNTQNARDKFIIAQESMQMPVEENLTNEQCLETLANFSQHCFINPTSRTSSFSCSDFVALLEATKEMPMPVASELDLFGHYNIYNFYAFSQIKQDMNTSDLFFEGWKKDNHGAIHVTDSIALLEKSENKEGAIAFIEFLLTDLSQTVLGEMAFPVTTSAFYSMRNAAMFPEKSDYDSYTPLTQDEAENYTDMIKSCSDLFYLDLNVSDIIIQEGAQFLSGKQTAETAALQIEMRVNEYLSS